MLTSTEVYRKTTRLARCRHAWQTRRHASLHVHARARATPRFSRQTSTVWRQRRHGDNYNHARSVQDECRLSPTDWSRACADIDTPEIDTFSQPLLQYNISCNY